MGALRKKEQEEKNKDALRVEVGGVGGGVDLKTHLIEDS
jgi:hypothetical protein